MSCREGQGGVGGSRWRGMMEVMYRERSSVLPGAVVWANTPSADTSTVLPDGCTDLLFDGERLLIAGPDTVAYRIGTSTSAYAGVRTPSGVGPSLWGVPGCDIVKTCGCWSAAVGISRPRVR